MSTHGIPINSNHSREQESAATTPHASVSETGSCSFARFRTARSITFDEESLAVVSRHLSFGGSSELRRGAHLVDIMRGCGKIFQNSRGSALTYELSQPCERIRHFISHNWSTSRWDKFFALTMRFNFEFAFCGIIFWMTLCCTAHTFGFSLADVEDNTGGDTLVVGMLCRLTTVPICVVCLLLGTQIRGICRWNGPTIFLDKVCIHQVDRQIQSEGIARLGAFLQSSDRMLLLYSEIYMERLWTVYEVAQFVLTTRPVNEIDIMPIFLPRVVFAAMPLIFLYSLGVLATRHFDWRGEIISATGVIFACIYLRIMRKWARHKSETRECLTQFEVQRCKVAVEEDRAIVYSKIVDLTRAFGFVDRSADEVECLEAFNREFRKQMPIAFTTMFGVSSFSYPQNLFLSLLLKGPEAVDMVHAFYTGGDEFQVTNTILEDSFWALCAIPFSLFWLEVMASCKIHWTGVREVVWMATIIFLLGMFVVPVQKMMENVRKSDDEGSGMGRMACIFVVALLITIGSSFSWRFRPSIRPEEVPSICPSSSMRRCHSSCDSGEATTTTKKHSNNANINNNINSSSSNNHISGLPVGTCSSGSLNRSGNSSGNINVGSVEHMRKCRSSRSSGGSTQTGTGIDVQKMHVELDVNRVDSQYSMIHSDSSLRLSPSLAWGPTREKTSCILTSHCPSGDMPVVDWEMTRSNVFHGVLTGNSRNGIGSGNDGDPTITTAITISDINNTNEKNSDIQAVRDSNNDAQLSIHLDWDTTLDGEYTGRCITSCWGCRRQV